MQQFRQYRFFLVLPILLGLVFFNTQFKTDISTFFIAGKNAQEVLLANEIQSGVLSKRYILAIGSEKNAPSEALIKVLKTEFKNINGVHDVWQAEEKRGALEAIAALYRKQGANLYSRTPEADLKQIFSAEGLAAKAKMLKTAFLSPQAELVKTIAGADPLLLSLNGLAQKPDRFLNPVRFDSHYQNLMLETDMSGMEVTAQSKIQAQIRTIFATQTTKFSEPITLEMTGVPVFTAATQIRMQQEITFISIVSSLALCGLFFWIFKSLRILFWVASLLITVVCSAIMVTNLLFGFVHAMTLAIGTTLIGICVDYPIHALVHGQATASEKRAAVVAKIFPSMLLGGATTLIGYFALGASGYPGFQQVAVYAGVGIFTALFLTRFVLPQLMASANIASANGIRPIAAWLNFCEKFRPQLLASIALLAVFSVLPLNSLTWMQDLQELTPEMNELKANDAKIRARMVSLEPGRFVLVHGDSLEQALQQAESVYQTLDKLKASGDLSDYFGLYPWLLSQQQQQKNAQLLKSYLTEENQQLWQQSLAAQGLSVEHLGLLSYPTEPPLSLAQVQATAIAHLLDNQIISNAQQTLLMIGLADHQPAALQAAFAKNPYAQYVSQRDRLNQMAMEYQSKAEAMLMLGMLAILLLLTWRYKNLWTALETLAPAFLSALAVLAFCAIFGVAISFLHLVGFLLIVSICVDYGIFYQENRGGDLNLTYQAMAASMLTSALAFGCLILAETTVLKILAQVVASGVLLGFLLCPIIIGKTKQAED
jgi:predicted exporter